MHLNRSALSTKATQLVELHTKRMEHGYAPVRCASYSMAELLRLGEFNTLNGAGNEYLKEMGVPRDEKPTTLLRKPATTADILELESRLSMTLPPDYKEFLAMTNGFGFSRFNDGIFNGLFPDPELFSADKVSWNRKSYIQLPVDLLDVPYEIGRLGTVKEKGSLRWKTNLPVFDRVLWIGTRDVFNLLLVPPDTVEKARNAYYQAYAVADDRQKRIIERAIEALAGSREEFDRLQWCCCRSDGGGGATLTVYSSFRRYLEVVVSHSHGREHVEY